MKHIETAAAHSTRSARTLNRARIGRAAINLRKAQKQEREERLARAERELARHRANHR